MAQTFGEACGANFVDFCECVQFFRYSVLAPARYEKIKKSEISNPLGGHLDFAEICCIFV